MSGSILFFLLRHLGVSMGISICNREFEYYLDILAYEVQEVGKLALQPGPIANSFLLWAMIKMNIFVDYS